MNGHHNHDHLGSHVDLVLSLYEKIDALVKHGLDSVQKVVPDDPKLCAGCQASVRAIAAYQAAIAQAEVWKSILAQQGAPAPMLEMFASKAAERARRSMDAVHGVTAPRGEA